jgi:cytosine/adenosine deaminase-related metal-dependent hydrolase
MATLIKGGTVVGYENGGHVVVDNGQVVYEGDRILSVGPHYEGIVNRVIDARGKLVIPGLVNHHMAFGVHMQLCRLDAARRNYFNSGIGLGVQPEGAYHDGGLRPKHWRASAAYAMATALRTGTTTFVMVPNYGRHPYRGRLGTDQELVDAVTAFGLRAYLSLPYLSGAARGTAQGTLEWVLREEEGWEGLEQAVEFARTFEGADEGRIRTFLFPYTADNCTPELILASKQAAAELGCTLKMHVAQYLLEFHEMIRRTAKTPIQFLYDLGFLGPEVSLTHAIFTTRHPWLGYAVDDDSDTALIADSGATVAHCPVVFARSGVALHSFSHYVRAGVPVSLGTDTSPHDMLMEMRTAALLSKLADSDAESGLAREVFDAATLGGARALMRDDIGRLAPGAKADIVLVDMQKMHIGPVAADDSIKALVYCANGEDVDTVIIDGITRLANGELLGHDLDALRQGAEVFNDLIWDRAAHLQHAGRPLTEFYEPAFPDWVQRGAGGDHLNG